MANFRKESPKFDGINFDSWKQKIKVHLLCLGPGYWLITSKEKEVISEERLESCSNEERDIFMRNILAKEALLLALLENEYGQVKNLPKAHDIWKALHSTFEGDEHAKKARLHNWICAFEDIRMLEDESIRSYMGRVSEIVTGIKSCGGTKTEHEVIWKILRTLTPVFKQTTQMIEQVIPCTPNF